MTKFNLQLFANHVNVTTDTALSAEMKTFYDMTLIDYAQPNLIHEQFGQERDIPQGAGKTIEFRSYAPLAKALTPLTEGVTPDGQELSVSTITATVAQYGDYITLSDMLDLTAIDNNIVEATKLLGRSAGLTKDTLVRDIINAGTNVSFASKWSGTTETVVTKRTDLDTTSVLKADTIDQVVAKLKSVNAPTIDGYYIGIIHPKCSYELKKDTAWIEAQKYGNPENLFKGEIGRLGGVRFVESSEAKIFNAEGSSYDLASNSHTLTINNASGYSGAITSVTFDGGTVAVDALIGKYIKINNVCALVTDNTATTITFASTNFGAIADNTVIYPAECIAGAVFSTLILGEGSYGVTKVSGGGLQTFVKQLGSSGTADPLNQRASVGYKLTNVSEILIPDYLVRVESTSTKFSGSTSGN